MPGAAFHLSTLDRTVAQLQAGPLADQTKAQIMADHAPFAGLGALGPDFMRYRPIPLDALELLAKTDDLSTLSQTDAEDLARKVQPNPEMAAYGLMFRFLLPPLRTLTTLEGVLDKLIGIAVAEDGNALAAAQPDLVALQTDLQALQTIEADANKLKNGATLAVALGKPTLMGSTALPAPAWRGHEYLRWRSTGKFAAALVDRAQNGGDKQQIAYAYGWLSHVAGSVVGAPFVNSIVGGPYRTHWWRKRLVDNHVDAWTHGRYGTPASMAGDTPTPPYEQWASLYGSEMQNRFLLDPAPTGPDAVAAVLSGTMPATPGFDKIADLLAAAATDAYGGLGPLNRPPAGMMDAAALREAYVGNLAVTWFMTGDLALKAVHPGPAPAGSETPPSWYTNNTPPPTPSGGGGGGGGGSVWGTILSIVLAILIVALATIFLGIIAGVAAAIISISVILATLPGSSIDWQALRTELYWLRVKVYDGLANLQLGLVKTGLAYPPPRALGTTGPVTDDSGVPLTRSRAKEDYPHRMDEIAGTSGNAVPPDADFRNSPNSPIEASTTRPTFAARHYPDQIIDGVGILNGGLAPFAAFPTRDVDFGGAAANAAELIRTADTTGPQLENFNLDGDRGYGWKTWRVGPTTSLSDPNVTVNAQGE